MRMEDKDSYNHNDVDDDNNNDDDDDNVFDVDAGEEE